jgi:hypothetical protein
MPNHVDTHLYNSLTTFIDRLIETILKSYFVLSFTSFNYLSILEDYLFAVCRDVIYHFHFIILLPHSPDIQLIPKELSSL